MNVVKGYLAGIAGSYVNKKAAMAAISKYTRSTDPEQLEWAYNELMRAIVKVPIPKADPLRTISALNPEPGIEKANFDAYVDPSFVTELQQNGFIDQLYKSEDSQNGAR
jgi:hypothetical protein